MSNLTNKTRIFFGVIISITYLYIVTALIFLPIPEANRGIIDVMFGSIGTIMGMVFTFYFGSSEGSSKKTDALMKKANTQSTPIAEEIIEQEEPFNNVQ